MSGVQDVDGDSLSVRNDTRCSLAIGRRVGIRTIADHKVHVSYTRRTLHNWPKIAREIVENQGSDFFQIEYEAHIITLHLDRLREPLRNRALDAARDQRVDEIRFRCQGTWQRLDLLNDGQRAIVSTERFTSTGDTINHDYVLQ